MNIDTACALASHINDHSTRFAATVLDFGLQAWVIIRDHKSEGKPAYTEPIVDVSEYLARAERTSPAIDPEYRDLLLSWLARPQTADGLLPATAAVP
ncbi:MAG: hypothetical protein V4671_28860 [Armatimonadota bacterium]